MGGLFIFEHRVSKFGTAYAWRPGIEHVEGVLSLKGLQLHAFSPYAIVYCYLEFKLRYLKILKLFSIRVKELSQPIVL